MAQGALGVTGVRRVWAGAGLQRAAYRGGAYRAASRTACCNFFSPNVTQNSDGSTLNTCVSC